VSGLKALRNLFVLALVSSLGFVLVFACLQVILTGFMISQLPFGHEQAYTWYLQEWQVTSQTDAGFPLHGYVGPAGAIEGLPVPYPVTSHFGFSMGYFSGTLYHTGVDMACPVGTPVTNVMNGRVTFAGYDGSGYGCLVVVENGGVQSFYAHLSRIDVRVGQTVEAGTVVGATGSTGWSTGAHLHWEVRMDRVPVDPLQVTLPGE